MPTRSWRRDSPLHSKGEIELNCANGSGIPGLFAAGGVTAASESQIVVAAGEGQGATSGSKVFAKTVEGNSRGIFFPSKELIQIASGIGVSSAI